MKKSAGGGVLNEMKIVAAGKGKRRQSDLPTLLSQQHCLRLRTQPLVDSKGEVVDDTVPKRGRL